MFLVDLFRRFIKRRPKFNNKKEVKLFSLVKICSGGAHGIFESSVGLVRKPFTEETINWKVA